jgi:hypothetical protein
MEEELAIHNVLVRFSTKLVQWLRYRRCELQLFEMTWIEWNSIEISPYVSSTAGQKAAADGPFESAT